MSPILVRPVREQLEHDRVIRLLQAKYKRKFDVAMNPGQSQVAPVGNGPNPWYPDLVLQAAEKTRKLQGVVEVETAESVNHLEAMSQWATFSKLRVLFYLYVPAGSVDTARRLCADLQIPTDEIWAYHTVGDQLRFALIQRSEAAEAAAKAAPASSAADDGDGAPAKPRAGRAAPPPSVTPMTPKAKAVVAAKSAVTKPTLAKPPQVKPVVARPSAQKSGSAKPGPVKPGPTKAGSTKPLPSKSVALKPVVAKKVAPAKPARAGASKLAKGKAKASSSAKLPSAMRKPAPRAVPRKAVKRTASASKAQKRK